MTAITLSQARRRRRGVVLLLMLVTASVSHLSVRHHDTFGCWDEISLQMVTPRPSYERICGALSRMPTDAVRVDDLDQQASTD